MVERDPSNYYDIRINEAQRKVLANALQRERTANQGRANAGKPLPDGYARETELLCGLLGDNGNMQPNLDGFVDPDVLNDLTK